jgi:hypothetical protein
MGLLNDLTREIAVLAGAYGFVPRVRLLRRGEGTMIELRAHRAAAADGATSEYLQSLSLQELQLSGAAVVASRFVCDAQRAFQTSKASPRRERVAVRRSITALKNRRARPITQK